MAPIYDWMGSALFAGALARSRRHFIERVRRVRRALLVGDGTGGFLVDLLEAGYAGEIVYVDVAPGMTEAARRRVRRRFPAAAGRIEFHCQDVREFEDAQGFDLICTHFFLDGFEDEELDALVARLSRCLQDGGRWLVTDFAPAGGALAHRAAQRMLLGGLYGFFRLTCGIEARRLPSIDSALERQGMVSIARRLSFAGVFESRVWLRPADPGTSLP